MTITKIIQDDLRKYTFVEKVGMKKAYVYIYYGKNKYKKIPYRASVRALINLIEKIKDEIGFLETKQNRDAMVKKEIKKPMMFVNVK